MSEADCNGYSSLKIYHFSHLFNAIEIIKNRKIMSRNKAKETLELTDYANEMSGIFSTCINESTIDEAPMAYKRMEDIINNIGDTVDIINIIKPVYNFKAGD